MNKQQLISEIVEYVSGYHHTPASNFKKDLEDFLKPRIDDYTPDISYPVDEFNLTPEQWQEYISKRDLK